MEFICDEKYDNIIYELEKRNWQLVTPSDPDTIPRNCQLIWKKLSKTKFPAVLGRYVNHIKGIHHLSNKSYLVYHMGCSDRVLHMLPPTWSSSFQTIFSLIGTLMADQLAATCSLMLAELQSQGMSFSTFSPDLLCQMKECTALHNLLLHRKKSVDDEYQSPAAAETSVAFENLLVVMQKLCKAYQSEPIASCEHISPQAHKDEIVMDCRTCLREVRLCLAGEDDDDDMWCYGNERLWLVKPVALSCGEGIVVAQGLRRVLQVAEEMRFKCVVQKYIERPMLVRNQQKFDIRQWVLVTSAHPDPLVIYGFSECYLRLSSRPYTTDAAGLDEALVHLCNQSVQAKASAAGPDLTHQQGSFDCDTMMSQQEFDAHLRQMNTAQFAQNFPERFKNIVSAGEPFTFDNIILPQLRHICVEVVRAARDRLVRHGKGFEWLGVDLMVTAGLGVRLLEVNVSPDTSRATPITARLVPCATADLFTLLLDKKGDAGGDDDNDNDDDKVGDNRSGSKTSSTSMTAGGDSDSSRYAGNESNDSATRHKERWLLWHSESGGGSEELSSAKLAAAGGVALRVADNSALPDGTLLREVRAALASTEKEGVGGSCDCSSDDDEEDEI